MNVAIRSSRRGARRLRISLAFGLIGALGWAAGAEAHLTTVRDIRIQDRTPGRTVDTNFRNRQPPTAAFTVGVPATVTAVQLRGWPSDNRYGVYTRAGTSGNWNPGHETDYNPSTTGPTVLQIQIRQGVSTVLQTFTITLRKREIIAGTVTGQATGAGGQATFSVTLGTAPSAGVTVAVASQDTSEGSVAPASLVFGTTN